MANIPEFQRRELASAAVGTPGVDNSGEMIGNAIAQSTERTFTAFNQLNKQKESAQAEASVAKGQMDFQRRLEEHTLGFNESYANYDGPIEERVKAYETPARETYNEILESMPEGLARDEFSKRGSSMLNQATIAQMRTADQNRMVLATKTVKEEMDTNAFDLAKIADLNMPFKDKVSSILDRKRILEDLTNKSYLSSETRAQLKLALPEQMARAYVSTAIIKNPAEAIQALESGVFGKIDPKVQNELKAQALNAIPSFNKRAQVLQTLEQVDTLGSVLGKMASGNKAEAVLALEGVDPKIKGTIQKAIYQEDINAPSDPEAEAIINDSILALEIDRNTKTTEEDVAALTETLTAVTDSYIKNAESRGGISGTRYKKYLSEVLVPYISKIRDRNSTDFISENATMWESVKKFFGNKVKERTPEAVSTFNRAMSILKEQPKVTSETITSSMRQALWENAKLKHPEYAFLVEPPDAIMSANGYVDKTGIGSARKSDAKVASEPTVVVMNPKTKKTKAVPKSQAAKLIEAGAVEVK